MWDKAVIIAAVPGLLAFSALASRRAKQAGVRGRLWWLNAVGWTALLSTFSVALLTIPMEGAPYPSNITTGTLVFASFVLGHAAAWLVLRVAQRLKVNALIQFGASFLLALAGFLVGPYMAHAAICGLARECI